MDAVTEWDLLAALPFLAAAMGILYVAIVAAGGRGLRLHRLRKQRRIEAKRRDTGATPWSEWLREINERAGPPEPSAKSRKGAEGPNRADGKWRE